MYIWGQYSPRRGGSNPPGEKFFTVSIFRKNVSKYAKLIVEPYICDNLNHNYRFFLFLIKKFWNSFNQKIVCKATDWFLSYFNLIFSFSIMLEVSEIYLILRYDCERLSNGMRRMVPFHNFDEQLDGFAPHLTSLVSGLHYASRPSGFSLRDQP